MRGATVAGSVRDALAAAADALAAAGVDTARLDAELMLCEAMGADRAGLAAEPEAEVEAGAGRIFGSMVRRRLRREPVAYILGRKGFRRLELEVDPRVLVPRPETELLVELALELEPGSVLDVGTGSGAVALAIADELPGVRVTAGDLSAAALEVARRNAARTGLEDRVRFFEGSLPPEGRFDLLVANLPYVSEAEWACLEPEIREYEPREALIPGPTGLEAIESLLSEVSGRGAIGAVALEVGAGQAGEVARLVADAGFEGIERRLDLAGVERVVVGRLAEGAESGESGS